MLFGTSACCFYLFLCSRAELISAYLKRLVKLSSAKDSYSARVLGYHLLFLKRVNIYGISRLKLLIEQANVDLSPSCSLALFLLDLFKYDRSKYYLGLGFRLGFRLRTGTRIGWQITVRCPISSMLVPKGSSGEN